MTIVVLDAEGTIRHDVELRFEEHNARLELSIGDEKIAVRVEPVGGYSYGHKTMQKLGAELVESGRRLIGCGSCARFQFSGMSWDMSGGHVGYCQRVGHRRRGGTVNILHRCGEHIYNEGWEGTEAWRSSAIDERRALAEGEGRIAAFEGAMVGLAVGDALGFPCEFRSREQILASFPPDGVEGFVALHDPRWQGGVFIAGKEHPPGTFSDDTQMSLAVADGLLDVPRGEFDELMPAIAVHFVEWSRSDDNDRAPGSTCMTGCENLAAGVPLRSAGVADSKGAGAPMRVVPIGLRFAHDRELLLRVARASSLLTHGHPEAVESSAAVALAVSLALDKQTPTKIHAALLEECGARAPELRRRLEQVPGLLDAPPEVALGPEGLGESWIAEEAVASALWCFWCSPADFRQTVLTAVNTVGDSDTIGCIAGGISGAFNGLAAIPRERRESIEDGARLRETGRRLHELR